MIEVYVIDFDIVHSDLKLSKVHHIVRGFDKALNEFQFYLNKYGMCIRSGYLKELYTNEVIAHV